MDKFRSSIWFLFIPLLADAGSVPFEDCGSAHYLESIEVLGCSSYPCHLKIGSTVQVTANMLIQGRNFNSDLLIQKVYFQVSTILLEVQVTPDPCSAVRGTNRSTCDLPIGERVAYAVNLSVQNVPPLPATLYWTIRDKATNEMVVCYRITVVLTSQ